MLLLYHLRHRIGTTVNGVLLNQDNRRVLGFAPTVTYGILNLIHNGGTLRYNRRFTSSGNSRIKRQEARITPHHLNQKDTFVRSGCITQFVDTIRNGTQRGVITDRGICAPEVIVYRAGQTDNRHIKLLREKTASGERAITTDHNEGIDLLLEDRLVSLLTAFGSLEFRATG